MALKEYMPIAEDGDVQWLKILLMLGIVGIAAIVGLIQKGLEKVAEMKEKGQAQQARPQGPDYSQSSIYRQPSRKTTAPPPPPTKQRQRREEYQQLMESRRRAAEEKMERERRRKEDLATAKKLTGAVTDESPRRDAARKGVTVDLSEPEQLRKAIVMQEILGPPKCLQQTKPLWEL
ncbi:MAG: hypothetical protein ACLFVU_10430 [Phycisphaerae bacterium]